MAGILTSLGEEIVLEALVNKTAPESLELILFVNDYTPVRGSTAANLTEASGSGYSAEALTPASWTFTAGGSPPGRLEYPPVTFTFTAALGSDVYGYALVQASSGLLVAAERFSDGPYAITVNGDEIVVTLVLTARSPA
jgi:hypothetical protein